MDRDEFFDTLPQRATFGECYKCLKEIDMDDLLFKTRSVGMTGIRICKSCKQTPWDSPDVKQWSINKHLHGYIKKGMWWFRLFDYGIHAKDLRIHDLSFSEREGYRKRLVLGNWSLRLLMRGGI